MIRRLSRVPLLVALPIAIVIGACTESLETSATCPLLCPGQENVIFDTVITPAYEFDSTLVGHPFQGLENELLLSARGDTLDVRAVIRFDTLPREYIPVDGDSLEPITYIDSAYISISVRASGIPLPQDFFIDAYDVYDSTLSDTALAAQATLFVPGRLLGTVQLDSATFNDSVRVRIPLDSAKLLAIISDSLPLRIGLQIRSTESVQMLVSSVLSLGAGASLDFNTSPDTSVTPVRSFQPSSSTPATPEIIAIDYVDYSIVVVAPDIETAGTFSVGGLRAARSYLRFDLPLWLTDTVQVLRAELELTQDPIYGPVETDSMTVLVHLGLAGAQVTDLFRAATLLSPSGIISNSLTLLPSDSGLRVLRMNQLVLQWRTAAGGRLIPSALILRSNSEGTAALGARFFGLDAADPAVRPRLRVSYTPAKAFGRP